jgi:hypothetical protein
LDLLKSKIYTGNITRLHAAIALREERPVLETRLDADDGLYRHYIQYIQEVALDRFKSYEEIDDRISTPNWLYWCSRRHIEWHSDTDGSLSKPQAANVGDAEVGYMNVIQHDKYCVTPGITIGFNVNNAEVPQFNHNELYRSLENDVSCYDKKVANHNDRGPCLEIVEDFVFCAIRSRTLTSAGMGNINLAEREGGRQPKELTEKLWDFSKQAFGVSKTSVKDTQDFLNQNKVLIAEENLKGQCKKGHSCKKAAKEMLRKIVDEERPEKKV